MKRLFGVNNEISVSRNSKGDIIVTCSCDYGDLRKEQLYINDERMASQVKDFWDRIKKESSLVQGLGVGFEEIDWYDSDVDCYEVPYFSIKKGLRKVKVSHDITGTIPKGWQLNVSVRIKATKTMKPIMAVINNCVSLSTSEEKALQKDIRKVLQGKQNGMHKDFYDEDDY